MPRGGKRKGSGRKSTWESGCKFEDTKLIRVPKAIVDELLGIAHKLDRGEHLDLVTKSKEHEQLVLSSVEAPDSNLSRDELIQRGKEIVYDKDVVKQRDRTSVRKALGALLGVKYETFKK